MIVVLKKTGHPNYLVYVFVVVDAEDLRHLSTVLSTMATEKQRAKVLSSSRLVGYHNLGKFQCDLVAPDG